MSNLVSRMTGRKEVRENVPVPVGMPRTPSKRERDQRHMQRRTAAAAMLGLGEAEDDDESIIPDDAEELKNITGASGIRMDDEPMERDREAEEPGSPSGISGSGEGLLTPRDALVAPDVTPQALEPIDASDVPPGKAQSQQSQVPRFVPSQAANSSADAMNVLLGRTSTTPSKPVPEPENVVTAESAQAMANTILNVGGGGQALLKSKQPMPDPSAGDGSKIMEAFDKYGPARTWNF